MRLFSNLSYNKKKKLSILAIIVATILINIFCALYIFLNEKKPLPLERPASPEGMVNIIKNGNTENLGYIDDNNISLFWFVQVTDTHLDSIPIDFVNEYANFLNWSYNYIHPFLLINTGDLAPEQNIYNISGIDPHVLERCQKYFEIVSTSPYAIDPNPYRYLDISGNHDRNCDWNAKVYLNYTLMGRNFHSLQNFFKANFSMGDVVFNLLDSSPLLAPPINFGSEGHLDRDDLSEFIKYMNKNKDAENIFVFQHHHPLETIGLMSPSKGMLPMVPSQLFSYYNVDALFYGHFHMQFYETYGDTVYIQGDRWKNSYYDYETNHYVRYYFTIISVDSNGINFVYHPFTRKPAIIITNPSNALFLDSHDSISNTRGDGHVRALVFTDPEHPIKSVKYKIDEGNWISMSLYPNSTLLYESDRGTISNPKYAIPDDGKHHKVDVKVELVDGTSYIQSSEVQYKPVRKPVWQNIFTGVLIFIVGIIVFINRDNLPLKRADRKWRRLTRQEKIQKRLERTKKYNKPWLLSYLFLAYFISIVAIPWAVLPLFSEAPGAIYTIFGYNYNGIFFLFENWLYSIIRFSIVLPILYWSIRNYQPEGVNLGAIILLLNAGLMWAMEFHHFILRGLALPGVYFDFTVGVIIFGVNFPNTILGSHVFTRLKGKDKQSIFYLIRRHGLIYTLQNTSEDFKSEAELIDKMKKLGHLAAYFRIKDKMIKFGLIEFYKNHQNQQLVKRTELGTKFLQILMELENISKEE
ncbi:MAG: metallophosphoesterase [Promethearchaeota archaeon]